ncbi:hypothetical protein CTI14_67245, partial [Methylobacterium radiotolerans]
TALYTSPLLAPEQGAKVMLDLQITGEAQISVVMLEARPPPHGRHPVHAAARPCTPVRCWRLNRAPK